MARQWRGGVLLLVGFWITCTSGPPTPSGSAGQSGRCSAANVTADPNMGSRCIQFSGFEWRVKSSPRFDPGPNAWSDATENVRVDERGLHLAITKQNGSWYSAEVALNQSLGYGTYAFDVNSAVSDLDANVVLGLFTYDYADPAYGHREIDIEFSPRLGVAPGLRGHFTVQPFQAPGHVHDFALDAPWTGSQQFEWRSDHIGFRSRSKSWTYAGPDVPQAGHENVRVNAWLFQGMPPTGQGTTEVAISRFSFTP